MFLDTLFCKKVDNVTLAKDKIAEMLSTNPEVLDKFENAYKRALTDTENNSGYVNAKTVNSDKTQENNSDKQKEIIDRIVSELVNDTTVYRYVNNSSEHTELVKNNKYISPDQLTVFDKDSRPLLTGNCMTVEIPDNYKMLVTNLYDMQRAIDKGDYLKAHHLYGVFRQGLDILDLDPIMYKMLDCNVSSMGYWLPAMVKAIDKHKFFKIPNTTIAKVPLPILQLTRLDYTALNRNTLDIVDNWAQKVFDLDTDKHYFIKTGLFSSKFDFRNAKITDPKEVLDIGEYLLFIHFQSVSMAQFDLSGNKRPVMYGAATTNEWVVRDFIEDEDDEKFTIYNGLPLHTEYRVFVDFDSDEVLGIHPYWDPKVMKNRFGHSKDSNDPTMIHDYITYTAQEPKLMERYNKNKNMIINKVREFLPDVELTGQWSIDIMQNGDKFWFIDMAIAETSAFYDECVPANKRIPYKENWLPKLEN